jgi:hypothetical protein
MELTTGDSRSVYSYPHPFIPPFPYGHANAQAGRTTATPMMEYTGGIERETVDNQKNISARSPSVGIHSKRKRTDMRE